MSCTDAIGREPFVFIDGAGEPYKVVMIGGKERWLCYWHTAQKSWVTLRKITEDEAREFKPRAISPEHAAMYEKKGKK